MSVVTGEEPQSLQEEVGSIAAVPRVGAKRDVRGA